MRPTTSTTRPIQVTRLLLGLLLLVLLPVSGCARRVQVERPPPEDDPSEAWAALLEEAAGPGGVDYMRIQQDRAVLEDYLAWVGAHGPRTEAWRESKEDMTMAFWINAYNAAVVLGVLDNWPLDSVRDVDIGVFRPPGTGFFNGQKFYIDGEWTSLHNLEHVLLVNRYQEPLVHAALNCASKGCPELRWYKDRALQVQLSRAMRQYLASDVGMAPQGRVHDNGSADGWAASQIFHWYADDFTDWSDAATVCEYLATYATGPRRRWLKDHAEDCPLQSIPYDWSLNAASGPEQVDPDGPPGDDDDDDKAADQAEEEQREQRQLDEEERDAADGDKDDTGAD